MLKKSFKRNTESSQLLASHNYTFFWTIFFIFSKITNILPTLTKRVHYNFKIFILRYFIIICIDQAE